MQTSPSLVFVGSVKTRAGRPLEVVIPDSIEFKSKSVRLLYVDTDQRLLFASFKFAFELTPLAYLPSVIKLFVISGTWLNPEMLTKPRLMLMMGRSASLPVNLSTSCLCHFWLPV